MKWVTPMEGPRPGRAHPQPGEHTMTRRTCLAMAFGLLAAIGLTALDARADWRHPPGPVVRGGVYYGHGGHGGYGYTSPYGYWHSSSVRRHHGLGEGGYCHDYGVRRFHGLARFTFSDGQNR